LLLSVLGYLAKSKISPISANSLSLPDNTDPQPVLRLSRSILTLFCSVNQFWLRLNIAAHNTARRYEHAWPDSSARHDRSIHAELHAISNNCAKLAPACIYALAIYAHTDILFIKAQGNTTELTTAKKNFIYVVIGALLILGAWIIATMIEATIGQLVAN